MHRLELSMCVALGLTVLAGGANAGPVDGRHDSPYGSALSTQSTQSSLGDLADFFASELDGAFGLVVEDTLYLLLAGNFNRFFSEPLLFPNELQLYLDTAPGGQNELSSSNPNIGLSVSLQAMAGLRFDDDFSPDFWLAAARRSSTQLWAHYAELPTGGGGAGAFLGASTIGVSATLVGGVNPFGVLVSADLSNTGGVTAGCDAASGAGVTTGIEWAIPLAAIGNPTEAIRICALLASVGQEAQVSNQVLGPVPPGTCALGSASGVDFGIVPGTQYFTVDATTPVAKTSWGQLKALYR